MSPEEIATQAARMAAAVDARLDEDIASRAAAMAAAVDARLNADTPLLDAIVQAHHDKERGAPISRGLAENEIFQLLEMLGGDADLSIIVEHFDMTETEVCQWCGIFLTDFYRQGWPNMLPALEANERTGITFHTIRANGLRIGTLKWHREWRCLWFLMQFYDTPQACMAEWGEHASETSPDWILARPRTA